jgi:protein ImuA
MSGTAQISVVERIREQIQRLDGGPARARTVLPFGLEAVDSRLPGGGLAVGALHEVAGGAIAQAGLHPDRVIYVEAGDEKSVLACFEEGARHGGLGAVVAEVSRLSMTSSRRLSLAAESSATIAIAVRRWRRQTDAADFGQPTASATRWRISALPSAPLPVPGVGRARWLVELIRCRAGESADFVLDACDAEGRLALSSDMAHGQVRAESGLNRA